MHRTTEPAATTPHRSDMPPRVQTVLPAAAPPLLLLVLAMIPFWSALLHPNRIALSVDILSNVSSPWDAAPVRARPLNGLQGDGVLLLAPMQHFTRASLAASRFPLWNPYALGGSPFFANDQSAVLYPLNVLTLPLPFTTGWALTAVTKLFLAGIGTYVYTRTLGVRRISATFGAVAFMESAPIVNWVHWPLVGVAICLPWLFWDVERLHGATGPRRADWSVFLAGVVATQFYGGHVETSLHILLATGLYVVYHAIQRRRNALRSLALCAAAGGLGVALGAFQLLPTLAIIRPSAIAEDRALQDVFQLPLSYLTAWVIPFFWGSGVFPAPNLEWGIRNAYETTGYVGVPCLILACGAWWTNHARRGTSAFFVALIVLACALVYEGVPILGALAGLPFVRQALNIRLVLVIGFALSVLAALGLDGLLTKLAAMPDTEVAFPSWRGRALLAGGAVMALLAFRVTPHAITTLFRAIAPYRDIPNHAAWDALWGGIAAIWVLATLGTLALLVRRAVPAQAGSVALLLLLIADLAAYGAHINPTEDARLLFPETPTVARFRQTIGTDRFAGSLGALRPNAGTWLGLNDLRAYEPTANRRITDYLAAAALPDPLNGQVSLPVSVPLLTMAGVRWYVGPPDAPVYTQQGFEVAEHIIAGGESEAQWFVAPTDGLSAIELFITPRSPEPVPLVLTLQGTDGATIARETVQSCMAHTGCPVLFSFPTLPHSGGQGFGVTVSAPEAPRESGVALWFTREPDERIAAGRLSDDAPVAGALYFRLFIAPGAGLPVAWTEGGFRVWAVPDARPRAYFATAITRVTDLPRAIVAIRESAATPNAAVLEGTTPAAPTEAGVVRIMHDTPGSVTLDTDHRGGDALLVLNETTDPGWRATVDGRHVPILHVNAIAQGVMVPEGAHTVRFIYAPQPVFVGGIISGAAGIVCVALLASSWWQRRFRVRDDH
jgi:hypothetical protein